MTLYSPIGYGFDEIYSSPQLTGSRLPTEITFSIPQTPQKWIIGKNSYISMKLTINFNKVKYNNDKRSWCCRTITSDC